MRLIEVHGIVLNPEAIDVIVPAPGDNSCTVKFRGGEEQKVDCAPSVLAEKIRKAQGAY